MSENKLIKCFEICKKKISFKPEVAIVLGSGLGEYGESLEIEATLPYSEINGFPTSTVAGHKGRFIFGYEGEVPVVAMQGRVHYYEGYPMEDVVLPIRLMGMMGAKVLFLTNASGGVNESFSPGDFMLIEDHIAAFIPSPLIGPNKDELGTRFPDMSDVYNRDLRGIIEAAGKEIGIDLKKGIYMQFTGPAYETPAEIRMSRVLGADAVGMSTVCEAIAAHHMGMKVCGVSCVTNMACGITNKPLNHQEVQENADKSAAAFKQLMQQSVAKIYRSIK
ncbi:MAG: purine-nucleoside phosphorylase [Lachnospiraceae bacterium]